MIVLTGGAGFIGSNVLQKLNSTGVTDIAVVDDLTNGAKMQKLARKKFVDYFDFREFVSASAALKNISHIIHLGAISDTRFTDGKILTEQNFTFSKHMLELARVHKCPFVYASSASVYGSRKKDFIESPAYESPETPYAISKWMFDQHVREIYSPAPIVGLRYFNVYGPGEELKNGMASFPYKCINALLHGKKIKLFEDGGEEAARDFVHVEDAVRATVYFSAWADKSTKSGIYNVGTGEAVTFKKIAELAGARTEDIELAPFPENMREGYQNFTKADLTNLRNANYTYSFQAAVTGVKSFKNYLEAQPCRKSLT